MAGLNLDDQLKKAEIKKLIAEAKKLLVKQRMLATHENSVSGQTL